MKKWYDEEYEFTVEVVGFLHGNHTEIYEHPGIKILKTNTEIISVNSDIGSSDNSSPSKFRT